MKTIRTILATFGVTSLLYGLFALISMQLNPAFTGRSIFQLFRDTGFVALVIGIGCVLSFVIMTVAIVSFRDDGARKKREFAYDDEEDDFLEEETVPEEQADEADESWSPEIKRKQRRALKHTEETPDLFGDDEDEPEETIPMRSDVSERRNPFRRVEEAPEEPKEELIIPEAEEPLPEENAAFMPPEPTETPEAEEPTPAPATKKCIYCGKAIEADSAFCIYCGKRV